MGNFNRLVLARYVDRGSLIMTDRHFRSLQNHAWEFDFTLCSVMFFLSGERTRKVSALREVNSAVLRAWHCEPRKEHHRGKAHAKRFEDTSDWRTSQRSARTGPAS